MVGLQVGNPKSIFVVGCESDRCLGICPDSTITGIRGLSKGWRRASRLRNRGQIGSLSCGVNTPGYVGYRCQQSIMFRIAGYLRAGERESPRLMSRGPIKELGVAVGGGDLILGSIAGGWGGCAEGSLASI